jgi:F-type H+-transporting ATPase subunit delta
MRGEISVESDHAARSKFADQIRARKGDALTIGRQLFDVCQVLDSNHDLESDLSDPSRAAADKQQLVKDFLAGSGADPLVVQIVQDVAGRQWSHSRNVTDAVEDIAIDSALDAADAQGTTQVVAQELAWIRSAILNLPQVRTNLSDSGARSDERVRFFHQLFDSVGFTEVTMVLAEHATADLRNRRYAETLAFMILKTGHHLGRRVVSVTAAVPLTDHQIQRIEALYSKKMGSPVHVNVVVDPKVVGGLRISAGKEVTNMTVAAQLSHLGEHFGKQA